MATAGCSTSPTAEASAESSSTLTRRSTAYTVSSAPDTQSAPNFVAKLSAAGPFKVGTEGELRVVVEALGAYHVNPDYKYKFKADLPAPTVKYRTNPVTEVKKTTKEATMTVPFVADAPGTYVLSGTCSLSVCTDDNCVIDKVDLATKVTVE